MSNNTVVGTIPENLIFIYNEASEKIGSYDVYPVYVSDATNEKTLETGRRWASGPSWKKRGKNAIEENLANYPITDVKLFELEKRSEGGRAYKVMVYDKYYVDFREDVLLDCIQNGKIMGRGEYGLLVGEFVFARVGAEMKLVRVGSELYDGLVKSTEDKAKKKISKKELTIGQSYSSRNGDSLVYCGEYDVLIYDLTYRNNNYSSHYRNEHDIYADNWGFEKRLLFLDNPYWMKDVTSDDSYFRFSLRKTHSLVNVDEKTYSPAKLNVAFDKFITERNSKIDKNQKVYIRRDNNADEYLLSFSAINHNGKLYVADLSAIINNWSDVTAFINDYRAKNNV